MKRFRSIMFSCQALDRPSWTWFRDSQRRLMKQIPHTGMVVSSDCGDSLDVHPINKKPIGERLARWALNQTSWSNECGSLRTPFP